MIYINKGKAFGSKVSECVLWIISSFIIFWPKPKIVDFTLTSKIYFILSLATLQRWTLCTGSEGNCNIPKKFPWSHWKALEPLSSSVAPVWISSAALGTEAPWGAELLIQQAHFEASNKEISSSPKGKKNHLLNLYYLSSTVYIFWDPTDYNYPLGETPCFMWDTHSPSDYAVSSL